MHISEGTWGSCQSTHSEHAQQSEFDHMDTHTGQSLCSQIVGGSAEPMASCEDYCQEPG